MSEPAGAKRMSIKIHLAASIVAAMVGALTLAACETSRPPTTEASAHHDDRRIHHVTGDDSAFRFSHHGYGPHGMRRHIHRWHRFH